MPEVRGLRPAFRSVAQLGESANVVFAAHATDCAVACLLPFSAAERGAMNGANLINHE
jgi:hypothetical protein